MKRSRIPGHEPRKSVERTARRVVLCLGVGVMTALLGGCMAKARDQTRQHAGHPLGTVDFPISCSERAQAEFNRAVALLHHMTYPQAREAFQRLATTDPQCAMAHWGIAMTLFQPLWPGWEDFAAFLSHIRFVKDHHRKVKKIAAVTESSFLSIMPRVAKHFVQAEIRHFDYKDKDAALNWLRTA